MTPQEALALVKRYVAIDLREDGVELSEEDLTVFARIFPAISVIESALAVNLPKVEAWQPIETAPKDGSDVLVIGESGVHVARFVGTNSSVNLWRYHKGTYCCHVYKATHWMPLPKPPGDTA